MVETDDMVDKQIYVSIKTASQRVIDGESTFTLIRELRALTSLSYYEAKELISLSDEALEALDNRQKQRAQLVQDAKSAGLSWNFIANATNKQLEDRLR